MTKAFETYKNFADQVRAEAPHKADGKAIITVSSLKPAVRGAKGDQVFYLNSKSDESIMFTLSVGGKLKSAKYIDKEAEKGSKENFVAKDYDKLASLVKDPALAKMAALLDWSKAETKEADTPEEEVEAEK